jgi:hypothetical protein
VPTSQAEVLQLARLDCGLSVEELWVCCFALGGQTSPMELEAILHGALEADSYQFDVIAHALNECFTAMGRDHPVPYIHDKP